MTRKQSILNLLSEIKDSLIISSTGKLSRELYELTNGGKHFYMQGSMGCAIAIGLGVALNTKKKVYVLSGDGALLMKLGSLATVLKYKPKNLKIIVLNNDLHDSCGGQPTNFKYIKDFATQCVTIIDVEPGADKNLKRIPTPCEQITRNFHENFYVRQEKKENSKQSAD